MAEPTEHPEIAPRPAGGDAPTAERIELVLPAPVPAVPAATAIAPFVAPTVYALTLANLLGLWIGRGDYVTGFDLFGASAGVLWLNQDGFLGALRRSATSLLAQRGRMRATGDESPLYALVPGLLNAVTPWLHWSSLLSLVLVAGSVVWVARRLDLRLALVCACVLASPAIMSFSIMGFPFLPSATVPFALSLGYVLPKSRRDGGPGALVRDVAWFAFVTFIAFNGYPSGQVFFVVPALAALTLPRVHPVRRASWLALSAVVAWVVWTNQSAPTVAALDAIPADRFAALVEGAGRVARYYLLDWYIDFPALPIAAAIAVVAMPRHRVFWACLLLVLLGLCSLSAFEFGGSLFGPRRVMPFLFVSAVAVATALAGSRSRGARTAVALLVCAGMAYTSYRTAVFATAKPSHARRNYNADRIYSLPYAYSGVDMQVWRDRIHDARVLMDAIARGPEQHVFFYGFSVEAEDGVNPQLLPSRLLLPLGYARFSRQTVFFDALGHNLIDLPMTVHGMETVTPTLRDVHAPFYVHVKEPEYDGASVVAQYLNRAQVTRVDFGLEDFASYRVDAYAPPGPIPVVALAPGGEALEDLADGLCRTSWRQNAGGYSPLMHWNRTLPEQLAFLTSEAPVRAGSQYYLDVDHRRQSAVVLETTEPSTVVVLNGSFWNPGAPMAARLSLAADDELVVAINGQTVLESFRPKLQRSYTIDVVLPAGLSRIVIGYHNFGERNGGLSFRSSGRGLPLLWRCPANFGS